MLQVALYSEDIELQRLLANVYRGSFQFLQEFNEEAINRLLAPDNTNLVYLDLSSKHRPLQNCIEFAQRIITSAVSSIVLADDCHQEAAIELVRQGADGYHQRSAFIRNLENIVQRKCEINLPSPKSRAISQQLSGARGGKRLIGKSIQMQKVCDLVNRVASLDASVLITGESGTGKELIARSIHNQGVRANQPFVAVSCSAIPESLLEAELFGHEKGAFTGTTGTREGYFEQAGSGTLFLDEIGDLSLSAQVKLLRVLQERQFNRLGSNRLIPLQARLIYATHRDLGEMVAHQRLREDFYYRINVIRINVPPLRERAEDIPEIATHFLRHYSQEFQLPMKMISQEAYDLMQAYSWPGNVREIENVIQRAIVLAPSDTIFQRDLPLQMKEDNNVIGIANYQTTGVLDQFLLNHKVKLVMDALRTHHGNKSLAARSLGISRPYLYRLIRYGNLEHVPDIGES
jgi:DNA-binding NtrC family response regulator